MLFDSKGGECERDLVEDAPASNRHQTAEQSTRAGGYGMDL